MIAIIAILAAILFPVFGRARENARRSSCQSNLKQIGLGLTQYTQDYDEFTSYDQYGSITGTPADTRGVRNPLCWPAKIDPYIKNYDIYRCPSATPGASVPANTPEGNLLGYWSVGGYFAGPSSAPLVSLAAIQRPAEIPTVYDDLDIELRRDAVYRPRWNGAVTISGGFPTYVSSTNGSFILPRPTPHFDGVNTLYADGHVKWLRLENFYPQARQNPYS